MKVVHLSTYDFGGAGKAAYRLHIGLQAIGVDSTMLVLDKKSGDPSVKVIPDYEQNLPSYCNSSDSYISERMRVVWKHWAEMLQQFPGRPEGLEIFTDGLSSIRLDLIKEIEEADIINLHWVAGMVNFEKLPLWFKNKKIVWTLHDMNAFTGGCHYSSGCERYLTSCGACPQLGSITEKDLSREIFEQKNKDYGNLKLNIVTPSRWLGGEVKKSPVFSKFDLNVIPYGLPLNLYKPIDKALARSWAKIPEDIKVILFGADNITNHRKGFKYLIDALKKIETDEARNILIITFGSYSSEMIDSAKYQVKNLGPISDEKILAAIYGLTDVFVIPSLEDNLPNTVLESLACGTPVVGFDIGGIPEMISHLKTGYLAKLKDTDDLANGIKWVLSLKNYEKTRMLCRKNAENLYDIKTQAEVYLDVYKKLMNDAPEKLSIVLEKNPQNDADFNNFRIPKFNANEFRDSLPKISVVTPSYNQGNFIEQTIKSVLQQDYSNFEHIVIDGGSTDGTIDILKKYPHLKWISEKDKGQSDALNKGFKLSVGEIIAWINSDDWYEPETFKSVVNYFEKNPDKNIVMGDCNLVDEEGKIFDRVINYERGFDELKNYKVPRSIPTQPAIFFRGNLLKEYGLLDVTLNYTMDFDLWMRFASKNRFYHLNCTFANYRFHKNAKIGDENWDKIYPECEIVRQKYTVVQNLPLVSVIIACYNYGKYLPEAINSVVKQTYKNFEIIIVNDGSTDNSLEVARNLAEKYSEQKISILDIKNTGPTGARILGFNNAEGEFLLSLDADDKIAPTYLEETLSVLLNNPALGYVYVDVMSFGDSNKVHHQFDYDFKHLLKENYFAYCSLIRKKAYDEAGGFDKYYWGGAEDWELWINLGTKGWHGKHLSRTLFYYNEHFQTSVSKSTTKLLPFIKSYIVSKFPSLYTSKEYMDAIDLLNLMPNNWQLTPVKEVPNPKEILKYYPQNQHLLYFLGKSHLEDGLYKESFEYLKHLHQLYPEDIETNKLILQLNSEVEKNIKQEENVTESENKISTTVFLLTIGDITFEKCKKAIEDQKGSQFKLEIITNISPFSKAAQEMIKRCTTDYFIQVDEDMILDVNAVEIMEHAIKYSNSNIGMICYHLYDVDREMKIQGVKIYRTSLMKDIIFHDVKASEMDVLEQMKRRGINWMLREEILGKHGTLYSPESIYLRYKSMYEKDIRAWNFYSWDLRKKVDKFLETKDITNLFAILGAAHGIINAPYADDKEKDFNNYNLKELEVFKNLLLKDPALATKYKSEDSNINEATDKELNYRKDNNVDMDKKFLIACTHFWPSNGGVESISEDLGFNLVKLGYHVDIATLRREDRTSSLYKGMNIISLDSSAQIDDSIPKWSIELRDLILSGNYSACILLADPLNHIIWSLFKSEIPLKTRVIIQPIINKEGYKQWEKNIEFRINLSSILKKADIISISKDGIETQFLKEESIPFSYIPNACTPVNHSINFRHKYNIPDKAVFILHVANLWPVKNHLEILEEFKDMPYNWILLMIGYPSTDSEYVYKVKSQVEKSKNVIYIPGLSKEEISSAMDAADFIILASIAEGAPVTILEAMSHGKPWIATSSCGSISENVGGIITSLDKFQLAVRYLMDNPEKSKTLGELGKKQWRKNHDWRKVIRAWEEMILKGKSGIDFSVDNEISKGMKIIQTEWINYSEIGFAASSTLVQTGSTNSVILKPAVSVVIPTYNRREKLSEAIQSVLNQDHKNIEIIVVNDAGEDVSDVINSFNNNRIKLINHKVNKGLAAARNTGIKAAKGKYIALLDDDDIFYRNHLEAAIMNLNENNKVIYTDAVRKSFLKVGNSFILQSETVPYSINFDRNKLLIGNIAPVNCFVFEKSLAGKAGLLDESLPVLEDWDFWLRLSELTDFKHLKQSTVQVNWYNDGSTMTSSKAKDFEATRKKIYNKYENELNKIPNKNEIIEEFNSIWGNDFKINKPIVSILALSFNQHEFTKSFIDSVLKYTDIPFELILIDNGSNKDTVDYLKSLEGKDKRIKTIFNEKNLGFPKAVNQGIKAAAANYILIANNDIIVTDGWLERMLEVAESDDKIGMVGPISNAVSGMQLDQNAKYPDIKSMHEYARNVKEKNTGQIEMFSRVAFLCTLIKRKLIDKIGGLDERFSPGNYEDDDYCLRAQMAGFKTVIAKDVFIHHYGSKSFTAEGTENYKNRLETNRKIFIDKWGGTPEEIWLKGKQIKGRNIMITLNKNEFVENVERTLSLIEEKDYQVAIQHLNNAIETYDHFSHEENDLDLTYLMNLAGNISMLDGNFDVAKIYFEKALNQDSASSLACSGLGDILFISGNYEAAKTMYEWSVKNDPGNQAAIEGLAKVNKLFNYPENTNSLFQSTEDKKEIEQFSNKDTGEADKLIEDAYNLFNERNFKSALNKLTRAEKLFNGQLSNPTDNKFASSFFNMKGFIYLGLDDIDKAKSCFEKALSIDPNSSQACAGLGEVLFLTEQDQQAKTMFEWAVKNNPDNLFAIGGLKKVNNLLGFSENHSALIEFSEKNRQPDIKINHRDEFGKLFNKLGLLGKGVEIGVQEGIFSKILRSSWKGNELYLIDRWKYEPDYKDIANVPDTKQKEYYLSVVQKFSEDSSVQILRKDSLTAANQFPDNYFDWIYIDADHSFEGCTKDLEAWYSKLKLKGVFAGHDYLNGEYTAGSFGVKSAVDNFIKYKKVKLFITDDAPCRSWYFVKQDSEVAEENLHTSGVSNMNAGSGSQKSASNLNDILTSSFELFGKKNFQEAIIKLDNAKELFYSQNEKKFISAFENLKGLNYLGLNEKEKARESFETALNENPESSQALAGLGELFYLNNNDADAKKMFEKALNNNPVNLFAAGGLSKVNRLLGLPYDHSELEDNVSDVNSFKFKAALNQILESSFELFGLKYFDEAIENLNKSEELFYSQKNIELISAYENLKGFNYLGLDNKETAKECFETALNINPKSSQACAGLAELFYLEGKDKEAKTMYEYALENNPDNQFALGGLERVNKLLNLPETNNALAYNN